MAVDDGILEPKMFMKQKEEDIVRILDETGNAKIKEQWEKFKNFDKVYKSKERIKGKYIVEAKGKKRYINPLVKIRDNIYRVAELDDEINKEILNFKNQGEIYYSI